VNPALIAGLTAYSRNSVWAVLPSQRASIFRSAHSAIGGFPCRGSAPTCTSDVRRNRAPAWAPRPICRSFACGSRFPLMRRSAGTAVGPRGLTAQMKARRSFTSGTAVTATVGLPLLEAPVACASGGTAPSRAISISLKPPMGGGHLLQLSVPTRVNADSSGSTTTGHAASSAVASCGDGAR